MVETVLRSSMVLTHRAFVPWRTRAHEDEAMPASVCNREYFSGDQVDIGRRAAQEGDVQTRGLEIKHRAVLHLIMPEA